MSYLCSAFQTNRTSNELPETSRSIQKSSPDKLPDTYIQVPELVYTRLPTCIYVFFTLVNRHESIGLTESQQASPLQQSLAHATRHSPGLPPDETPLPPDETPDKIAAHTVPLCLRHRVRFSVPASKSGDNCRIDLFF